MLVHIKNEKGSKIDGIMPLLLNRWYAFSWNTVFSSGHSSQIGYSKNRRGSEMGNKWLKAWKNSYKENEKTV